VAHSYWKTGSPAPRRPSVVWPSLGQVLRQLGLIALVGVLWGGVLAGYLRVTATQAQGPLAAGPATAAAVAAPTDTLTLPATHTPALAEASATPVPPTHTPTPAASDTPAVATPEPTKVEIASSTPEPSPTPTPEPSPVPTETPTVAPTLAAPAGTSFAQDVLPIFERRCVKCHGGERTEEGLVLKTYADVMAGSVNGPVIEPGNAVDSYLVEQITSGKMPKRGPRLLPAEIQAISDWIDAGAPDN